MKKVDIYTILQTKTTIYLALLMAFSLLPACEVEDDIPPPSAYVEPEENPEEGCFLLFVVPTLNGEEALDFECEGPEEYITFGEKDGSPITVGYADNPDNSGINASDRAVEVVQAAGVEPWAGFFFDLSEKIDFSVNQTVKIKVYSPGTGQNVNLKLEDQIDGSIAKEISAVTTVANEWEELSFIFSSDDTDKFDRLVLFFDFLGPKIEVTTHYFDDIITVEGGSTGEDPVPTVAAPVPSVDPSKVISMFSDAYVDVPVDTWRTVWSAGTLEDTEIQGDAIKLYTDLTVVGVETVTSQIDATAMTHFHTDIWSPNATIFRIKLVDFGANGTFDGPGVGDDVEHEYIVENPTQEAWVGIDIPLADFTGLTTRANIAQLIYSTEPAGQTTIYMDNVYFYDETGISTEPLVAAPAPTENEADVISMFSDAYIDVAVDTWRTIWSNADFEDVEVAGNATKKYSSLGFVGIETVMNQIDISGMTHFHVDVWTPDAATFRIKLVDFGPNGAFDGPGVGDDTEHELSFENPVQGEWISLDIPLDDFVGMTTRNNFSQLIFSADPSGVPTLFIDNVYFY